MDSTISLSEWINCLHILDDKAATRFVRTALNIQRADHYPSCMEKVQIAVADWLTHLGFISDAQILTIIKACKQSFTEYAKQLETTNKKNAPTFTLVVCDCVVVSCTGRDGFFNFDECKEVSSLPESAVTHIICDVTALYFRLKNRSEQQKKIKTQRNAGNDHCKIPGKTSSATVTE